MATFAATGVSTTTNLRPGQQLQVVITGTFVAVLMLQRKVGAGWQTVREIRAALTTYLDAPDGADYRLQCYAYTSGTATYALTALDTAAPRPNALDFPMGDALGVAALGFGRETGKALQLKIIDEVVSLVGAGAKFVAMTTPIPSGAVILSVQANIETLVVAGGTSVKVGLGPNATDVDKYGISSALTKNLKINTIPAWTVLSGAEQIDVCVVKTDGSDVGNSNATAGSVRVRIVYLQAVSLTDAP